MQSQFQQAHTVIEQVIDDCDDEALPQLRAARWLRGKWFRHVNLNVANVQNVCQAACEDATRAN